MDKTVVIPIPKEEARVTGGSHGRQFAAYDNKTWVSFYKQFYLTPEGGEVKLVQYWELDKQNRSLFSYTWKNKTQFFLIDEPDDGNAWDRAIDYIGNKEGWRHSNE
jgi:hypothetical protein